MVGLIQKSGFIKPGKAAGYLNYIATRDGVEIVGPDGYLEYMATRPGSHGLFSSQSVVNLDAVMKEAEQHAGYVWTLIYSTPCIERTPHVWVTTTPRAGASSSRRIRWSWQPP